MVQRFDCLALDCPLFGNHLLEASAGTGKTFSIEHIYVRLILESIEVEQILAVTFTRAAARELKGRIHANLENALQLIQANKAQWEYLHPYMGSNEAVRLLSDALAGFECCQIFTIHGFCYRMLTEFAFEAGVNVSLVHPDEGSRLPERLKSAARDFLENGIEESLLCKEQMLGLLRDYHSINEIIDRLLLLEKGAVAVPFSTLLNQCKAALHSWKGDKLVGQRLLEDFQALQSGYKATKKGNLEAQVLALADLENPTSLRLLLKERGSLFSFLDPKNRKAKTDGPLSLHYPQFFDWAREEIAPLLEDRAMQTIQAAWYPIAEKILNEEEHLDPDQILIQMKNGVANESFAKLVRQKYVAAIVDEFQDTDAMQWDIFQQICVGMRAVYLVGDPKQSIYRFRKADVYTYLQARDFFGEENVYHLDTNFRSSKQLIGALNALFSHDWLHLPKLNRSLPYHPVKAGATIDSHFPDAKGALHFFMAEGEPNSLFDEVFIPFVANEIEQLQLRSCAVLVKDRYQVEKTLCYLHSRGIAAVAKSPTPLGQTVAFQSIRELFEAVMDPRDSSAAKVVMAGPFASKSVSLGECKILLEQKGLVPFVRLFAKDCDADMMHIFELLFAWEKREGFTLQGLKRQLRFLADLEPEEGGRKRMQVNELAVQIMTLHISKGLEFEVVFALALAARTPAADTEREELAAEKHRQLYVAMTRAKRRLYVPIAKAKDPQPGTHSPMELFCPDLEELKRRVQAESVTFETVPLPFPLSPPSKGHLRKESACDEPKLERSYPVCYLNSFTTLAQLQEKKGKEITEDSPSVDSSDSLTIQTMPRGSDTGILIHRIFEQLFSSDEPIWRDPKAIHSLVEKQLLYSSLAPWQKAIEQMVCQTVTLPLLLDGEFFSLSELEPRSLQVEVEFVYATEPHFIKGFIDLIFSHRGQVYFLDWKTNWLQTYGPQELQEAIRVHDYGLQASIYREAIQRYTKGRFGGAFYFFVRGGTYAKID